MSILSSCIRLDPEYAQLLATVRRDFRPNPLPIVVSGLCDGASDALLISLLEDTREVRKAAALLICSEEKECVRLASVLERFGIRAGFYMARDLTFHFMTASHEYEHERLRILSGLAGGDYDVILTTPDAAMGYTIPPDRLLRSTITIDESDRLDPQAFANRLSEAGYVRVDLVDSPGQFAVRGGIVDIFPPYGIFTDRDGGELRGAYALRIELFGDEIDRMGVFEPDTQRMTQSVTGADFQPARELLWDKATLERLKKEIAGLIRSTEKDATLTELKKEAFAIDAALQSGGDLPFSDKYVSLIYPERATLVDYFPESSLILIVGTTAVRQRAKGFEAHLGETVAELLETGMLSVPVADYAKSVSELDRFFDRNITLHLDSISYHLTDRKLAGLFGFRTRHTAAYSGNEALFLEDLDGLIRGGYRCVILADNPIAEAQLKESIQSAGFSVFQEPQTPEELPPGSVCLLARNDFAGFELIVPRFAVLSAGSDIRPAVPGIGGKSSLVRKKRKDTKSILSFAELETGDYVVHEKYGIGQYTGIETLTVDGVTHDYIGIQYAGSDRLFLPVEQLDRVSKYIGAHADDGLLKLSKMGGESWQKSKQRAKAAVKDMAKDLIRLYAQRMRLPGFAFPADDKYQKAFEEAFEYTETESQKTAADEIKSDMMRAVPMDRLLCGDVGYGKTEVALRAAYKAVLGGKQVALLVPTTLLALQHYQTMVSRMRSFAVNVEMLSRFRTPKQQAETLRRLARGDVDILVGTHRLLSKDVKFHDLGLLIVDEEQRFGVAQKEKLKQLSSGIDVLSLSATPIPRTLNMAMGGIRDISILDEAPTDRLPVQTYVLEEDPLILEEAMRRELRRGGQIFYLHNDVETIYSVAAKIQEAIPEAHVRVGHGKMEKEELEKIWEEMLAGKIDILVCTTIIETGVDVPNANTLIVSNSHRLGLSQLHQIRGRVGRSSRRAYAYFTYPPYRALTDIARKRLEAVREYAEFGAGFKIALRDLEIRGAGNLLGAEQHGHLDAIGYDLYIKLLNRAVLEERGEEIAPEAECTVSLDFDAYLPEKYIPYPAQRMALYKKIALIATEDDLQDMLDELGDRYGEPPKPTQNLLKIARIHSAAVAANLTSIRQTGNEVHIFPRELELEKWTEVSDRFSGKLRMLVSGEPHLVLKVAKKETVLDQLQECIDLYRAAKPSASQSSSEHYQDN
ncbi:MAG: transcription-repair coupling factor [Ruminococcaceae bacterium]|nr:transcription-repair coupling factor [Oscillospiraceae bacterium]